MNLDGLIYCLIPYLYYKGRVGLLGLVLVWESYGGLRFLLGFSNLVTPKLFQSPLVIPAFNEYFLFPDQEIPGTMDRYADMRSGYKDLDDMFQSLLPKAKVRILEGMRFPLSGSLMFHIHCFLANSSIPMPLQGTFPEQTVYRLLDSLLLGIPFRLLNSYYGIIGNSSVNSMKLEGFLSPSTFIKMSSLESTYNYVGAINLEEGGEVPEFTPFSYTYLILFVALLALILMLLVFLRGFFSSGSGKG